MTLDDDMLSLWEATVCEIRSEISSWMYNEGCRGLFYAKDLCDVLEDSMVAAAKGRRKTYTIGHVLDIAESAAQEER